MANKNLGTADVATSVQQTDSILSEIGGAVRRVKVKDLSRSLNLSITSPEVYAYGIEFDVTVSSTAATRIGNMSMHRTLPVQTLMKGCLLDACCLLELLFEGTADKMDGALRNLLICWYQ